ncbi:MAG: hypothetical protein Q9208_000761 [Pyrenodesmia sp. 3 TL-2023]
MAKLESKGVPRVHERIHVSSRCHLNFALHAAVDGLSEEELGTNQIGTTKKGVGPAYSTKAAREGLRIEDIYDESFEPRLRLLAEGYRKRYGQLLKYSVEDEIQRLRVYKEKLRPYIIDAVEYMQVKQKENCSVLVEGCQALSMTGSSAKLKTPLTALVLDVDYGSYPNVIGVVKAYNKMVLRYSHAVNYYDSVNLTKLDVLDTLPTIRVAVAYITADGEKLTMFPAGVRILDKCTVEYVDFQGWQSSTKGARTWSDLPPQAQKYIEFIESSIGVKIAYIGTGPDREDMIVRE